MKKSLLYAEFDGSDFIDGNNLVNGGGKPGCDSSADYSRYRSYELQSFTLLPYYTKISTHFFSQTKRVSLHPIKSHVYPLRNQFVGSALK